MIIKNKSDKSLFRAKFEKTLQELENCDWGKPNYDSHLVVTCHKLRRVPLKLLTIENLRMLIGQNIGLKFIMPLALERLNEDPFAEGDYYPGDLLAAVLRSDREFWSNHLDYREQVDQIVQKALLKKNEDQWEDEYGISISAIEEDYQLFSNAKKIK